MMDLSPEATGEMTTIDALSDNRGEAEFCAWLDETLAQAARDRLVAAIAAVRPRHSCTIMAAAMEDIGAGMPEFNAFWHDLREEAAFWADIATPPELEAYAGAALRRIARVPFAPAARKRLFVMLWETMQEADKRAFLGAVDPDGKFRGARK